MAGVEQFFTGDETQTRIQDATAYAVRQLENRVKRLENSLFEGPFSDAYVQYVEVNGSSATEVAHPFTGNVAAWICNPSAAVSWTITYEGSLVSVSGSGAATGTVIVVPVGTEGGPQE